MNRYLRSASDLRVAMGPSLIAALFFVQGAEGSVLWIEQAQRLQEVSASLLDTIPVTIPLPNTFSLGVRADLSFLPTPNPRVGGKMEKLPTSPIQSVPLIFSSVGLGLGNFERMSAEISAGILPPGVEKLLGIKASLLQTHLGGRFQLSSVRFGQARLNMGVGMARTTSSVEGSFSSTSGTDRFSAAAEFKFVEASAQHSRSGVWAGVALGSKKTTSRLSIQEDATDLKLTDTLANARQPYWSQFTLGIAGRGGWSIALSELVVPDRVEMPRLSFSWNVISRSDALRE